MKGVFVRFLRHTGTAHEGGGEVESLARHLREPQLASDGHTQRGNRRIAALRFGQNDR